MNIMYIPIFTIFLVILIIATIIFDIIYNFLPTEKRAWIDSRLKINKTWYFIIPFLIWVAITTMIVKSTWWVDLLEGGVNLWLCLLILIALSFLFLGKASKNNLWGLLLNKERRMSVSQFQQVLWTVVILSALIAAVVVNEDAISRNPSAMEQKSPTISVKDTASDSKQPTKNDTNPKGPLEIEIPLDLWYLMGITTVSLVGSPIIKSSPKLTGRLRTRNDRERAKFSDLFNKDIEAELITAKPTFTIDPNTVTASQIEGEITLKATIKTTPTTEPAEEQLDLGKVQMLYLTLIILFAYSMQIAAMFNDKQITMFPQVSAGMVTLLGISNAGYLGFKASQANA